MPQPTITQLFNPTPSGVVPGVTPLNVVASTWLSTLQNNANNLGLPTTSWQSGGVTWTVEQMLAACLATSDGGASLRAQGAFLDFAATGTVTFTDATQSPPVTVTLPVTPDPSIPTQNPSAALGWLDILADSVYNVRRTPATFAQNNLYLANTTGGSLGSYLSGTFHVANATTGATFKNVSTLNFAASVNAGTSISAVAYGSPVIITTSAAHGLASNAKIYIQNVPGLSSPWATVAVIDGTNFSLNGVFGAGTYVSGGVAWVPAVAQFVADLSGPVANSSPGSITSTTTSVPGGFVDNFDPFTGSPWQSNASLAALCRAQLSAVSPNGAKGAYLVYALQAGILLAAQSPPKSLTAAVTRAVVYNNTGTGTVTVVVANSNGGVPGVVNVTVLGATNASPIVLTVPSTAAMPTGMLVLVSGVQGNAAANGYWTITNVDGTHISLQGSTGSGAWVHSGVIEAGDLGLVDSIIQAYATPNAVTSLTVSASTLTVNISATVYVPAAKLSDYGTNPASNKGTAALANLFPNIPIGGTLLPGAALGVVDISEVSEALFDAGTSGGSVYTVSVQNILINGLPQSLSMAQLQVAVYGTMAISAQGI